MAHHTILQVYLHLFSFCLVSDRLINHHIGTYLVELCLFFYWSDIINALYIMLWNVIWKSEKYSSRNDFLLPKLARISPHKQSGVEYLLVYVSDRIFGPMEYFGQQNLLFSSTQLLLALVVIQMS